MTQRLMKYFKPMNLFEMARKWNDKLLSLDLGDKNVGVCRDGKNLGSGRVYPDPAEYLGFNSPGTRSGKT